MIQKEYELIAEQIDSNTQFNCHEIFNKFNFGEYFYSDINFGEYFYSDIKFKELSISIQYELILFLVENIMYDDIFLKFITKIYDNYIPIKILNLILQNLSKMDTHNILVYYSEYLTFEDYQQLLYHNKYLYHNLYITNNELQTKINELYRFLTI